MAWSTGSAAASMRYGRTASCRPSPSKATPTESRWRRCGLRTWATAVPGCGRSRWSTASRAATRGCAAAWRPVSTRATPSWTGCSLMALSEMALSDRPAERHRQVAGLFTARVRGTPSWDAPSPGARWGARDVVRHLTEWFPGFLASGAAIELPRGPSVDENPVAAWQGHCDGVQAVLDDPETAHRELANPHIGGLPLATASDNSFPADGFWHPWDRSGLPGRDAGLAPASALSSSAGW